MSGNGEHTSGLDAGPTEDLWDEVLKQEDALLESVLGGDQVSGEAHGVVHDMVTSTASNDEVRTACGWFHEANASQGSGSLSVPIQGTETEVAMPASLFSDLSQSALVLMVSHIEEQTSAGGRSGTAVASGEVKATVHVELISPDTRVRLKANNLSQPIKVTLSANRSAGIECAYWDNATRTWRADGVALAPPDGSGLVVCEASHLTLFAAILRGFVKSFQCSQAAVFTVEAIQLLGQGTWYRSTAPIIFFGLLAAFALLFVVAAALDACRRWREVSWRDEYFLVAGIIDQPETQAVSKEQEEAPRRGPLSYLKCCMSALCCACVSWCHESSALRDALDDVVGNWISNFAEVRDFMEGLWEEVVSGSEVVSGTGPHGAQCSRPVVLVHKVMSAMLMSSARRQASASIGVASDDASFLISDPTLHEILRAQQPGNSTVPEANGTPQHDPEATRTATGNETNPMAAIIGRLVSMAPSPTDGTSTTATAGESSTAATKRELTRTELQRLEYCESLHQRMEKTVSQHFHRSARWCSLPLQIARIFLMQNPFVSSLSSSIFMSSKMRVLFFACDIIGSLLLSTFFFSATGMVVGKRSRGDCTSGAFWEQIGRLLAVGMVSVFIAGIPVCLLRSLHRREFKRFPHEGCPGWKRQLRIWRVQDRLVWCTGLAYLGVSVFFIAIFLANVVEADHGKWLASAAISLVEDTIIIPLSVALVIPLLAALTLSTASLLRGRPMAELLCEQQWRVQSTEVPLAFVRV